MDIKPSQLWDCSGERHRPGPNSCQKRFAFSGKPEDDSLRCIVKFVLPSLQHHKATTTTLYKQLYKAENKHRHQPCTMQCRTRQPQVDTRSLQLRFGPSKHCTTWEILEDKHFVVGQKSCQRIVISILSKLIVSLFQNPAALVAYVVQLKPFFSSRMGEATALLHHGDNWYRLLMIIDEEISSRYIVVACSGFSQGRAFISPEKLSKYFN